MDEQPLRDRIQELIRQFGLLDHEHTPCGRPVPTSQAHAIQVLGLLGTATQRELAARLNLDESTVSRLVDHLVQRGWLERAVDEHNRRRSRLTLTAEGRAVLADICQASAAKFRLIQERIPPERRKQVLDALETLIAAIGKDDMHHADLPDVHPHTS